MLGGASTVVQQSDGAALRFDSWIGFSETLQTEPPLRGIMGEEACSPRALSCLKSETHPAQHNPHRAFRNFFAISLRLFTDMHGRFEDVRFVYCSDLVF